MKAQYLAIMMVLTVVGLLRGQSTNQNYIKSTDYKDGYTSATIGSATAGQKVETVQYFDGLGRPIQSVGIRQGGKINGTDADIISYTTYDGYGRQNIEYLPISGVLNDGNFTAITPTNIGDYYYQRFSGEWASAAVTNAYSEKLFESSPLNRVLKQAAPGESWKMNNGHEIEFGYSSNTSSSEVKYYYVTTAFSENIYMPTLAGGTSYYAVNTLYKSITYDENHTSGTANSTEAFKDKQGRVILKRTYGNVDLNGDGDTIDTGESNALHDTYYVYDDFGNLTYVLPPKAEPQTAIPDANKLAELCYQYKYDQRNRLVEKKIPGKGWESIVYNKLDQPIMTQDDNLKAQNKWLFTKYDVLGRVAYIGIKTGTTRYAEQTAADGTTSQWVLRSAGTVTIGGVTTYYNENATYPIITASGPETTTINYYDDYVDINGGTKPVTVYTQTPTVSTKGLSTVSKTKVLGTSNWITGVSYYDMHNRPIYSYTKNDYLGTTDITEINLIESGKPDDIRGLTHETKATHKRTGKTDIVIIDKFSYDHSGKLLSQTQKINTQAEELIVLNQYDELGQLMNKKVGGDVATVIENSLGLQTVDYKYNIRGWLTQINNPTTLGTDLFGFKINYNTVGHGATPLYNGNISETEWKTQSDNSLRWYKYGYDNLNRITSGTDNTSDQRYSLQSIAYDKNGNITNLLRKGHVVPNPVSTNSADFGIMDNLTYSYQPNSNKLLKVADAASTDTYGFKDDAVNTAADTADDYTYDVNGNLTTDSNKAITNISYNHLNLPVVVNFGSTNKIEYIYDATGVKLKKIVSTGTTTEYAGNYIYENGSLQFFHTPEGYVEPINASNYALGFRHTFQYKDHLGNIRLAYKDLNQNTGAISLSIVEEHNYYPFGLKHNGYNGGSNGQRHHKYMFGGKELQDEIVGSNSFEVYDFGARNYDAALGRWMNLDPLAEKFPNHSPYSFCFNNPVYFIDPDGMAPKPPKLNGITTVANVMSSQKWINYNNNIVRTTTFLGFELSISSKHEQCADYRQLQVEQGSNGNYTAEGSKSRVDMYVEKGGDTSKFDLQKGVDTIIENLADGKAVMAGVMYNPEQETGNPNGATNHYVTIVGMGTDDQGAYFSYYDNYSGKDTPSSEQKSIGTNISKNKFRLQVDSKGNYYFADADNNIPLHGNKEVKLNNKENRPSRYVLTEVRDND